MILAALLAAVAVLAWHGPGRRRPGSVGGGPWAGAVGRQPPDGASAPATGAPASPWARAPGVRSMLRPLTGRRVRGRGAPVLLAQVAAALQAGADPRQAWWTVASVRTDPVGVPDATELATVLDGDGVESVVAACRLAAELGAPVAGVLTGLGGALERAEESAAARAAALAGPRASARLLTGLPLLGVLVAAALGADLRLMLTQGVGGAAVVSGLALLLLGRRWTVALLRRAEAAGRT